MNKPSERAWSVPVRIDELPETGARFALDADAATRAALARLGGVDAVKNLRADFNVTRHGPGVQVTGIVRGTVAQTCVVTLEPLENEIEESVDLVFVPDSADDPAAGDQASGETAERLVDGKLDLGGIATEFLVLGIDPYPRKPGAVFAQGPAEDATSRPFAALGALIKARDGS